jgi:hypothetical protein
MRNIEIDGIEKAWMGTFTETAFIHYCLSLADQETNFRFLFPFAAKKLKFVVSVFCLQQTNGSCHFPLVAFFHLRNSGNMEI